MPLGLVVLGFVLSFVTARRHSQHPTARANGGNPIYNQPEQHVAARHLQAAFRGAKVRSEQSQRSERGERNTSSSSSFSSSSSSSFRASKDASKYVPKEDSSAASTESAAEETSKATRDATDKKKEKGGGGKAGNDREVVEKDGEEAAAGGGGAAPVALLVLVLVLVLKLAAVVLVGAVFFKAHPKERDALTWTDALYFMVVTSTTVRAERNPLVHALTS